MEPFSGREDTSVKSDEIAEILEHFSLLLPDFPKDKVIAYFAGIRAATFTEDFFIRPSRKVRGFIHVAGIREF